MSVQLKSIKINRKKVDNLPLVNTYVSIEINEISLAFINAFRRTSLDELMGYSLQVPFDMDWKNTTDEFMLPQFVVQRISLIPLKPNLSSDFNSIKFDLNVKNTEIYPLYVYSKDLVLVSGKLSEPIFNPTFKICVLQPDKQIVIKGIYIGTGIGKDNASFQRVRCAAFTHLDIPQYDVSETHLPTGTQTDNSGYKISSMVSNPRHHLYTCVIPATNENKAEIISIFNDVCNNIKDRLKFILSHVKSDNGYSNQLIDYSVIQLAEGTYEGILIIKNETHTIGELLKRTIFELIPDIINIRYNVISHEDSLKLVIQYKEHVTKILVKVLKYCISTFEILQKQINEYKY